MRCVATFKPFTSSNLWPSGRAKSRSQKPSRIRLEQPLSRPARDQLLMPLHPLFSQGGVGDKLNRHRPAAGRVGLDQPVRLKGYRLMDELEPTLRLAHGFDRECP